MIFEFVYLDGKQGQIQDFWRGGGGSRLGLQAKKGGQMGVQFWVQC